SLGERGASSSARGTVPPPGTGRFQPAPPPFPAPPRPPAPPRNPWAIDLDDSVDVPATCAGLPGLPPTGTLYLNSTEPSRIITVACLASASKCGAVSTALAPLPLSDAAGIAPSNFFARVTPFANTSLGC